MKLKAWERQPKETTPAYEAFLVYRDMPYVDDEEGRSYSRVAAKLGKSETIISRWGSRWNWQYRIEQWDRQLDSIRDKSFESAYRKAVREMQDRHVKLAVALLGKAVEKLNDLQGKELSPAQLLRYIEVGIKAEREARGLPSSISESQQGDKPATLSAEDMAQIDDDIEEWYAKQYGSRTDSD